ncbi:terminase small subunit [Serratia marcescens]|uniref:terminase small subunit n=1 Tax=Serratia marcescens TaxID=615 RepID=UPI0007453C94|nr:terminase small subunit [Serratia marcescens]MBH3044784.1 terminase small subunit [Serratia marcescens]MBH3230687.1 terminase small subunit [Serratia marcescens]MBN5450642.1 terminase small subunit [Serratia marcescens]MDP8622246.1 terminase small subunit [Serratia marcescens]
MAKPDWGALQNQFLTEHAKTKISPKAWCEANGLNYTSARRYIKLPAQNDAQSAQKKVRSAQSAQNGQGLTAPKQAPQEVGGEEEGGAKESQSLLKPQHEQFAQNIAQGMPQKEAAICAGYAPTNAESQASVLLRRPDIKARVKELRNEAALLVSFNAGHLAELSYKSAQLALKNQKFGQVAPNVKNAAQLTGIDMSSNKTEVNVDLAGLSYGKVCIVTPANCPEDVWASHMEKLREGKPIAQS